MLLTEDDVDLIVELTQLMEGNKEIVLTDDCAAQVCYIMHMALEFDKLIETDNPLREKIWENMRASKMRIDSELAK